jgi:hypothetical protein
MRGRIGALLNREDGASMIIIMIVAVGLFMMVPVFVDYASLHYTRRVTQTGADAAALAAAIDYANDLSIHWPSWSGRGLIPKFACCYGPLCPNRSSRVSKICVISFYVGLYVLIDGNRDSIGDGSADDYAQRNGTEVADYSASTFSGYEAQRIHFVEGIPVPPVSVKVKAERRAPMIYANLYGRNDFTVHASARAEAYLDRYSSGTEWCGYFVCCKKWFCLPARVPNYDFHWKVRLVE